MKAWLAVLLFMFIFYPEILYADEQKLRQNIQSEVLDLFTYEEFNQLEDLSLEYLQNKSRTPSGIWRLSLYFTGIRQLEYSVGDDDGRWRKLFEKIDKWVYKYPNSSAALIAKGVLITEYAWLIRGGKHAYKVPKEKWPKFLSTLKTAKKYMLSIKDKADHNPEWYVTMAKIMRGLNEKEIVFMDVMNEGLTKHSGYYPIYFEVMTSLQPKWGGNYQKMEGFANAAAKISAFNEGTGMYARLYWYIYQTESQIAQMTFFKEYNVSWPKMKRSMYDVIKSYPDPWNIESFAMMACEVKDAETAKDLIGKIENPDLSIWQVRSNYEKCKRWANGLPVESVQDESQISYMNSQLSQWFEQLSYSLPSKDFEGYVNGMNMFYGNRVLDDYHRDVKIKYESICEADTAPENKIATVKSFSQTKDEFLQAETAVSSEKTYKEYENSFSSTSYDEKKQEMQVNYKLRLVGNVKRATGFAASVVEMFPITEFRSCSAIFNYTRDNILKMRFENCEILIQEGCYIESVKK